MITMINITIQKQNNQAYSGEFIHLSLKHFFTINSYNQEKKFYNNLFENIDSTFFIVFAVTKVLNRIGKYLSLSGVER